MEAEHLALSVSVLALVAALFGLLCRPRAHRKTWTEPAHPCHAEAFIAALRASVDRLNRATAELSAAAAKVRSVSSCAVRDAAQQTRKPADPLPGTQHKPAPQTKARPAKRR